MNLFKTTKPIRYSTFSTYLIIFALLMIGDGIMSYVLPTKIENVVGNKFFMGLIMAFSSVIGLACDFIFSNWFQKSAFSKIMRMALVFAIIFPMSIIIFGEKIWSLVLAMFCWGIYYELAMFGQGHFVDENIETKHQPIATGVIGSVWSIASFVAPILATLMYKYDSMSGPLLLALIFYILSSFIFLSGKDKFAKKVLSKNKIKANKLIGKSFYRNILIWKILLKKIWPIYILNLMAILLISGFWSVGTLMSEELGSSHKLGILFFSAWTAPPLLFSALSGLVTKKFRKKKTAFVTALISGILISSLIFVQSVPLILIFTLLSSSFFAIGYPGIDAAIQEYIKKLDYVGNSLIGLKNSSASVAYIFGPVLAGLLAQLFSNQVALGILGIMFAMSGLVGILIIKREIKMPYQKLGIKSK